MKRIDVSIYKSGDIGRLPGYTEVLPNIESTFTPTATYTGTAEDGETVFVCGIVPYWKGHAEAWTYVSSNVREYVGAYGLIRDILHVLIVKWKLHRITARCRAHVPEQNRFLRHLGFTKEGTMPWYGPNGEDYNVYGRLILWQ